MAARSVYTLSRREQWQYAGKPWLSSSLFVLLLIGVVVGTYCIIPNREAADLQGATAHSTTGKIKSFTYGIVDLSSHRSPDQVNIALNGTEVTYWGTKFLLLHKRQRVQVTYRTGKSGNVYVTDITPEGKAKP